MAWNTPWLVWVCCPDRVLSPPLAHPQPVGRGEGLNAVPALLGNGQSLSAITVLSQLQKQSTAVGKLNSILARDSTHYSFSTSHYN